MKRSVHIVALLDRPSPKSFGMVPFVEQTSDSEYIVHGLKNRPAMPLSEHDLDELIDHGSILPINQRVEADIEKTTVAGWLGKDFKQKAVAIPSGIPEARLYQVVDQGQFWLADRDSVKGAQEDWVEKAARQVFENGDVDLAKLMIWVLPDHERTRAAIWHTKPTDNEKQERIAWWVRLERDAGHPITPAALTARLKSIVDAYRGGVETSRLRRYSQRGIGTQPRSTSHPPFFGG